MRLSVNVDHIATLRQARMTDEPDPVWAASQAELSGACGITIHLRGDRRHIQDRDVEVLRKTVAGVFNLEMKASKEIIEFLERQILKCPSFFGHEIGKVKQDSTFAQASSKSLNYHI